MNYIQAIFLGILQGLTEFLPVSSSGHLVVAQSLLPDFNQPGVFFDVILHLGTLFAVLIYFRKKIIKLNKDYLMWLVVGSIPAAFIGYFLSDTFESLFSNLRVVGVALFVTGVLNFLIYSAKNKKEKMSVRKSFLVGLAQAAAIIPGISRSGATIFAGTRLGVSKKEAAEFSFLLSAPAIFGATIFQFLEYGSLVGEGLTYYIAGFLGAIISGYFAIKLVLQLLVKGRFDIFGYYCVILASIILFL